MAEIDGEVLERPAATVPLVAAGEQERRLQRRLAPLVGAAFVAGLILWLPVEKLFMAAIGFDAALVGAVAAAYAGLVPVLEVVTGVVADRWSRRGVLVVAYAGLAASSLVGGLSRDVPSYLLSALLFGVYVACSTGTTDAMVYDTVLEETGSGSGYAASAGRLKLASSVGFLLGALGGGVVAAATSPRTTYLLTVPLVAVAVLVLLRFREPAVHRTTERVRFREQLQAVWEAVGQQRRLRPVVAFLVLAGALMTVLWEFHQLWLVGQTASVVVYGPFMAALFLADGAGGWLAGRTGGRRQAALSVSVLLLLAGALLLATGPRSEVSVVVIAGMMVACSLASILMSTRLHAEVGSSVRAGAVSGVSSLTWMLFTPAALAFGELAGRRGLPVASWLVVGMAAGVAAAVAWVLTGRRTAGMRA